MYLQKQKICCDDIHIYGEKWCGEEISFEEKKESHRWKIEQLREEKKRRIQESEERWPQFEAMLEEMDRWDKETEARYEELMKRYPSSISDIISERDKCNQTESQSTSQETQTEIQPIEVTNIIQNRPPSPDDIPSVAYLLNTTALSYVICWIRGFSQCLFNHCDKGWQDVYLKPGEQKGHRLADSGGWSVQGCITKDGALCCTDS